MPSQRLSTGKYLALNREKQGKEKKIKKEMRKNEKGKEENEEK